MRARSNTTLVLATIALALASTAAQASVRTASGRGGLQRALRHAKAGDKIVVRGVVRGDVTVAVPGVVIDGRKARFVGNVEVDADRVTFRRARFQDAALRVTGDDFTAVECRFVRTPLEITGDRASVERNAIEPKAALAAAVTIRGDDADLVGNTVSSFVEGFRVEGSGAGVRENTFDGGWTGATVVGGDATVSRNEVRVSDAAFLVSGDRPQLVGNKVTSGGTWLIGDDASVTANDAVGAGGRAAVTVSGDRASVTFNTLDGAWGAANVQGDAAVVAQNVVRTQPDQTGRAGAAVLSVGDGAWIHDNTVDVHRDWQGVIAAPSVAWELSSAAADGIASFGGGTRIEGNDVTGFFSGGTGIRAQGDGNTVDANTVHDATNAFGIALIGDDNSAGSNEVEGVSGEGVVVQGDDGIVSDTSVNDVSSCGFLLVDDARLENCSATGCSMGVVNLADGSTLVGTTVSGNAPYDLVDLGRATVAGDSDVGGVATDRLSFRDFDSVIAGGFIPAPKPGLVFVMPNSSTWR